MSKQVLFFLFGLVLNYVSTIPMQKQGKYPDPLLESIKFVSKQLEDLSRPFHYLAERIEDYRQMMKNSPAENKNNKYDYHNKNGDKKFSTKFEEQSSEHYYDKYKNFDNGDSDHEDADHYKKNKYLPKSDFKSNHENHRKHEKPRKHEHD